MTLKLPERKCHWLNHPPHPNSHMERIKKLCARCDGSETSSSKLRCDTYLPTPEKMYPEQLSTLDLPASR